MTARTRNLLAILLLLAIAALALRFAPRSNAPADATRHVSPASAEGRERVADVREANYARISDEADVLAPFAGKLAQMADAFDSDLGVDLHVATRLGANETIEAESTRVFEERKIGTAAPAGGILILLNPTLASARIEVGYSLEGSLTDLEMGRLTRDQLAPYASRGAAGMAVMDVLHYLRDQIYFSAATGDLALGDELRRKPEYLEYARFVSGGGGAKAEFAKLAHDVDLKRVVPSDQRARYAPQADAAGSVDAFLRVTADLAGDPTLALFTEGSRLMRANYPYARFEELRRLERLRSSQPFEIREEGDYAVATSTHASKGFVPILLHREEGLWRVDLVETWKNLFFDADGNYYLRNSGTPYAFGLKEFGKGSDYELAATKLDGRSIAESLEALDGKHDVVSALRRGDIWFRNAFVFPKAYLAYEEARKLAPDDPLVLEMIGNRAGYLGFPELAIPALERVGRGVDLSVTQACSDAGDSECAQRWVERALAENPYDWRALQWKKLLAERGKREDQAREAAEALAALSQDVQGKAYPLTLDFEPAAPKYDPDTTIDVNGTRIYDHSKFAVALRNPSRRSVDVESVMLTSMGTAAASGLGDIKGYWTYPAGGTRLRAGETVSFEKQWGFTVDTGHDHVRYVFHTCWHGVDSNVRQCRTQWVDALP